MTTKVGRGCDWQHSMAHPRKPIYRCKNLAKLSYASRVIANFVPNFVATATGSAMEKCNWQHSMAHPRKPLYRRKNLLRKPSYSQFCPKFRCHNNGGRSGKMQLAAFDGPSLKTLYRRKNLAKISTQGEL